MTAVAVCYVGGEMMENKFMSLSPYQLVGCLRAYEIEAEVIEITPANYEDDALLNQLANRDIVGFSCNTFTYPFAVAVVRRLKACSPETVTVMGGIHVLRSYEEILIKEPVDFIIRGEADHSFPQFILALRQRGDLSLTPGLAYRSFDGNIHCIPPDKPALGLDFPLPAYELLPKTPPIAIFETSRGCPFRCTFCSIDQTSRWRGWDPLVVADRFDACMTALRDRTSLRNIMFGDDNFATNQTRAAAILQELHRRHPKLILSFETRAREILLNPAVIHCIAEQQIRSNFLFGIECGYDEGLKRVQKNLTVDEVRRCAQLLKDCNVQQGAVFSYIVGFPWENEQERMQTLSLANELYEIYGVKSTCFYWLPTPSSITKEYNIHLDYSIPFWWRKIQIEMNESVSDVEAELMAKVNANGNFSETRIDDTSRPGRSPREMPLRANV